MGQLAREGFFVRETPDDLENSLRKWAKKAAVAEDDPALLTRGVRWARMLLRRLTFPELSERIFEKTGRRYDPVTLFRAETGSYPGMQRLDDISKGLGLPLHRLLDWDYLRLPKDGRDMLDALREVVLKQYAPHVEERQRRIAAMLAEAVGRKGAGTVKPSVEDEGIPE